MIDSDNLSLDKKNIDWSNAEALAFGSLLNEGFPSYIYGRLINFH